MPRPINKKDLLELSEINFNKLLNLISELPEEIKNKTFIKNELNERDKTISDIITHLHEWHLMMQNWYKIGMSGKKAFNSGGRCNMAKITCSKSLNLGKV